MTQVQACVSEHNLTFWYIFHCIHSWPYLAEILTTWVLDSLLGFDTCHFFNNKKTTENALIGLNTSWFRAIKIYPTRISVSYQ